MAKRMTRPPRKRTVAERAEQYAVKHYGMNEAAKRIALRAWLDGRQSRQSRTRSRAGTRSAAVWGIRLPTHEFVSMVGSRGNHPWVATDLWLVKQIAKAHRGKVARIGTLTLPAKGRKTK